MRTMIKAVVLAPLASLAVTAASAQDTFDVELPYDANASAQANYTAFEKKTKLACRRELNGYSFSDRARFERECRAELMDKAIAQLNNPEYSAIHEGDQEYVPAGVFAQR